MNLPDSKHLEKTDDSFEYFFIRSQHENGLVIEYDPNSKLGKTAIGAAEMSPHLQWGQLFKCILLPENVNCVSLINRASGLVLTADATGWVFQTDFTGSLNQQWSVNQSDQWINAAFPEFVLTSNGVGGAIQLLPTDINPAQSFEMIFPSNFVYLRNADHGQYLTAAAGKDSIVTWQPRDQISDLGQLWFITSNGNIANCGTAQVIQVGDEIKSSLVLTVGAQYSNPVPSQQFNINGSGGTIRPIVDVEYAIGGEPNQAAIVSLYVDSADDQIVEIVSPSQFFMLNSGFSADGGGSYPDCLSRNGMSASIVPLPSDHSEKVLFTVSRYGELISLLDGFILQNNGIGEIPNFIDPTLVRISGPNVCFQYSEDAVVNDRSGFGKIALARDPSLGLIIGTVQGGNFPWVDYISKIASEDQVWKIVGTNDNFYSNYLDLVREYFENPIPYGDFKNEDIDISSVENLPKTVQVITTLVFGVMDIFGINTGFGEWSDEKMNQLAVICLGEPTVAAKIAIVMQGAVTAASVISVADGITKKGLWSKILNLIMPRSFWGWVLLVASISIKIAAWMLPVTAGAAAAITGSKVLLLCANIAKIIAESGDDIAREVEILSTRLKEIETQPISL